jgi:hypothetical protein
MSTYSHVVQQVVLAILSAEQGCVSNPSTGGYLNLTTYLQNPTGSLQHAKDNEDIERYADSWGIAIQDPTSPNPYGPTLRTWWERDRLSPAIATRSEPYVLLIVLKLHIK